MENNEKSSKALKSYLIEKNADFLEINNIQVAGVNLVSISVEWGDWKHSHGYLDHVMEENDYLLFKEQVTEEDGSDCYSSVHLYYRRQDSELVRVLQKLFQKKKSA